MRILFTGASSFTGMWFVHALADRGHDVVAIFRGARESYDGVRRLRVEVAAEAAAAQFATTFGDDAFMALLGGRPFDVLCHHAAQVTGYRDPDFDIAGALDSNTRNIGRVLRAFRECGGKCVVVTGSVFEAGEGAGNRPLRAFSPYGVSKGLTSSVIQYYACREDLAFSKFVIPNPFGPLEEPRFTSYLVRTWLAGETATVATPAYVRDNIHVSLLAGAYARFVEEVHRTRTGRRLGPSGYVETQGAFAERFARALAPRLRIECPVALADQVSFSEPAVRINVDRVPVLGWSEEVAWDEIASYYQKLAA